MFVFVLQSGMVSIISATDKIMFKIPERLKRVLKRNVLGNIMNIFCSTCLSNIREGKVPAQSVSQISQRA